MRLFVAIPLADVVRGELVATVARLRPQAAELRWTAPESWHITLQFLGNTEREQYEGLVARLGEVRRPLVPVRLTELGAFDRAGVVHVGVDVTPELAALQQAVTEATGKCGFAAEARAFRPHITLARSKGHGRDARMPLERLRMERSPDFTPFKARDFALYESFLGQRGARYEVRARFELIGPAEA